MQALWAEGALCALWNAILSLVSGLGRPLLLCTGLASQYLVSEEHDWLAHRSKGDKVLWGHSHVLEKGDRASHQAQALHQLCCKAHQLRQLK